MFPKGSVFAVVAFVAFVSLGALLFPQVGQAQDCLFDCGDLGSGPAEIPPSNSPQALDIAYCFDRACVLSPNGFGAIFSGSNNIPTPRVTHNPIPPFVDKDGQSSQAFTCPGTSDVQILGNVVAVLRDSAGDFISGTQAQASLTIVIKGVTCSTSGQDQILSKVLTLDPHIAAGQPRLDVFAATSNITVGAVTAGIPPVGALDPGIPPRPAGYTGLWWDASCPTNTNTTTALCAFPLGMVEFQSKTALQTELPATASVPTVNSFHVGEVYRAVKSTKFVGFRDCKGDPSVPPAPLNPSTIACSVGGGEAQGLFTFVGSWSGAVGKTINPKSGTGQFDILTPLFGSILPETVTASADSGPEVPNNGCNDNLSQNRERCFFTASALLPNGCTPDQPVAVLVRGKLDIGGAEFGFASRDFPICNLNK